MARIASLISTFLVIALTSATIAGAQGDAPDVTLGRTLHAALQNVDGTTVAVVLIAETNDEIVLNGSAVGLVPGPHGIHVHETGACDPTTDPAFASAGGHYNPTGAKHGEHAGDVGNITAEQDGTAIFQGTIGAFTLDELMDADGSSIIIHAEEDENDPAGESYGARIACGVLSEAAGEESVAGTAATEPTTEPVTTEPAATQPVATQPPATQSPATQSPATQPPATQPVATQPVATEPAGTEPVATEA